MPTDIKIIHRPARGICPVNGILDIIETSSQRSWSNKFVYRLGQGGGSAYLRFATTESPRQVGGVAGPRQHTCLAGLLQGKIDVFVNRSFKFTY